MDTASSTEDEVRRGEWGERRDGRGERREGERERGDGRGREYKLVK